MMANIKSKILIIIVTIISIVIIYLIYNFFYSLNSLPKGDLLESIKSPTNEYVINSYLVRNSLSADAIRVELINNKTLKRKNIYWWYPESTADIKWINEDIVEINGHTLNIYKDRYDWRKQ